jgi:hypothetical protein
MKLIQRLSYITTWQRAYAPSNRRRPFVTQGALLLLAASALAILPSQALADEGMPIQGAFSATASATHNTGGVAYCGGTPLALAVEAQGNGFTSLGALSFSLLKTINVPGAMHGCLTLTTANGDTLNATYDGTEGVTDASGFRPASGTLIFTGGTGRFQGASGSAKFTAVFLGIYPLSSFIGGTPAPLQVMAYYVIQGNVLLHGDN